MVSTPDTDDAEDWLKLLSSLTDDELDRYGEIARDQRNIELGRWWAQVLCVFAACIAFGFFVRDLVVEGGTRTGLLLLAVTVVLGIWPYRKAKMRLLWDKHCAAVTREKARRQAATD